MIYDYQSKLSYFLQMQKTHKERDRRKGKWTRFICPKAHILFNLYSELKIVIVDFSKKIFHYTAEVYPEIFAFVKFARKIDT